MRRVIEFASRCRSQFTSQPASDVVESRRDSWAAMRSPRSAPEAAATPLLGAASFTCGGATRSFSGFWSRIPAPQRASRLVTVAFLTFAAAATSCFSAQAETRDRGHTLQDQVLVSNPTKEDWQEAPVAINWTRGDAVPACMRTATGDCLPVQADDLDHDGTVDEIAFLAPVKAGENATFFFSSDQPTTGPAARAHAGMFMGTPGRRGFYGPGWESDLIGFRLYWELGTQIDLFCKPAPVLALEQYARTDLDYHRFSRWGMDVLKVGDGVGIGGFGAWINGNVEQVHGARREFQMRADGPVRAVCDLIYTDWVTSTSKLDLTARMSIWAGQAWAECRLSAAARDGKPLPPLVAGIVKHTEQTEPIRDAAAGLLGRWGNQALGDLQVPRQGNLGIGVVVHPTEIEDMAADGASEFVRFRSGLATVTYRYAASWWRDTRPLHSAAGFRQMLRSVGSLKPVVVVKPGAIVP